MRVPWPNLAGVVLITSLVAPLSALAQPASPMPSPPQLDRTRDRGTGVPTSMFGTYITGGELLVYPFYEYYRDDDFEYNPSELGYAGDEDYRGRYRAHEGLLLVAYGLTDDVAVEFEVAVIDATLEKSPADPSALPDRLAESGLGDIEGQLRWRWARETDQRPELFSYTEVVVPHDSDKVLIGTPGVEFAFGVGVVRGLSWGTVTARASIAYEEASSSHFDVGEYAVEYLRRLSPSWRLYAAVEGSQDEVELIGEMQWHVTDRVFVRFNSGFGITSKATDWAPEIGVVFSFGGR